MLNNAPLYSLTLDYLVCVLHNENISARLLPTNYGDLATNSNRGKNLRWLITLDDHPVKLVVCPGVIIRFQLMIHSNPPATASAVRKLRLRKLYPNHCLHTSARSPSRGLLVEARIPHTEPVIALVDSLRAAEHIWEEFKKDD